MNHTLHCLTTASPPPNSRRARPAPALASLAFQAFSRRGPLVGLALTLLACLLLMAPPSLAQSSANANGRVAVIPTPTPECPPSWSIVSSPNPSASTNYLFGVDAVSSNDVWAAGRWSDGAVDHTLIKHWDGVQWSVVPSPDVASGTNWLFDVSAHSPTDVWAVGYFCCGNDGLITLVEHWDGVQVSISSSPNPSTDNNYLRAVTAISSDDVWAVGRYGSGAWLTLTEHYSPTNACTPTPTATSTPSHASTPTSTIIPTITPTPLPMLVGHVNWEARPTQPNTLQQLPITLTLRLGNIETDYPVQTTDRYGSFTVTLGSLPSGTYSWRADDTTLGQHSANYLANSGSLTFTGAPTTNEEMGTMRAGDASNDNFVNLADFNIMKVSFGLGCGQPGYDNRSDFTGDCLVNITDFTPLKANFGHGGAPPIRPGPNPPTRR